VETVTTGEPGKFPVKDGCLLLGVTGGIASGKSTVARMLEKMGAPLIDFDVLSRIVVEPGKPAWKEIVTYFGEQILREDKTLNRKALSDIVFRDRAKRRKLESFTHPRIHEEFVRRVKQMTKEDPAAIIQVVVPLLIEANLRSLFDKLLLVYIPEEMQIRRLLEREPISRETAIQVLRSQLPIEEKRKYADYIVDNSGPLEETRRQVEEVWTRLKKLRNGKRAGREKPTPENQ
jgi:dephospho-CoA kinase